MSTTIIAYFRVSTQKQGRSGALVFVLVRHEISGPQGLAITEEHDIVYRDHPNPADPAPVPPPAPRDAAWQRVITPGDVLLFRYSALTFNGHRIHYDYPYVTKTEGYPDLVMNGGLTTLLVFELARTHAPTPLRHMASRNVRPLFVNREIRICGEPSPDNKTAKLWALDDQGALALSAEAEFQ